MHAWRRCENKRGSDHISDLKFWKASLTRPPEQRATNSAADGAQFVSSKVFDDKKRELGTLPMSSEKGNELKNFPVHLGGIEEPPSFCPTYVLSQEAQGSLAWSCLPLSARFSYELLTSKCVQIELDGVLVGVLEVAVDVKTART